MKAIHTVDSLAEHHGGPSRTVSALCDALSQVDVSVDLVTIGKRRGETPPLLPSLGVRTHVVDGKLGKIAALSRPHRGFKAVLAQLADRRGSVFHDHGLWLQTNHSSAQIAKRHHIPRIVSPRGMLSPWALDYHRWKKSLAWHLFQARDLSAAQVLHATSEQEAQDIRRAGARQPIAVIPNGVDLPKARAFRHASPGERRALYLSRIHPQKGVLNLIDAWARIRPDGWRLTIAGHDDDGHRSAVAARVAEHSLADNITLTNHVADAAKWNLYENADLFILPTFTENFGLAIAEALGMAIPVITTKGAPWSGLERERCGWWVDLGVDALAAALREATNLTDDERQERGRRGRAYVLREFSWQRIAREMRDVYAWMLGISSRPASVLVW